LLLPGDITTAAVSVKAEWINMGETDEIKALLAEIRDTQREYLAEYREVTRRSLELQQQAVKRQEQLGRLYRRVVVAGGVAHPLPLDSSRGLDRPDTAAVADA
jgi:hypothetical protein